MSSIVGKNIRKSMCCVSKKRLKTRLIRFDNIYINQVFATAFLSLTFPTNMEIVILCCRFSDKNYRR